MTQYFVKVVCKKIERNDRFMKFKILFIMILWDNVYAVRLSSDTPQFCYKMTRYYHETSFCDWNRE